MHGKLYWLVDVRQTSCEPVYEYDIVGRFYTIIKALLELVSALYSDFGSTAT